jgi:hypothetical protein
MEANMQSPLPGDLAEAVSAASGHGPPEPGVTPGGLCLARKGLQKHTEETKDGKEIGILP